MPSDERTIRETADDARRTLREASRKGREGAEKVKEAVAPVLDSVADALGGWDELDKTVKKYNPTLAEFAKTNFFAKYTAAHGPAKFLLLMLFLSLLQTILPIFVWPLDFVSQLLGFLFLYNTGMELLKAGFESSRSPPRVKSILATFMITSLAQLVPRFMFDTVYHFGALWGFFLPALLFITPTRGGSTIAVMICDTFFAQIADVITSVLPASYLGKGKERNTNMMIAGAIVALLFWIGFLGSMGSFVAVWAILSFHTIHSIGNTIADKAQDPEDYKAQQTVWHNLLAIWLWRYLFNAVEGISIPGVISIIGLILLYLPSYFLFQTVLMFGMLMTKKVSESRRASTWFAKWLLGGFGKKSSSSSRAGSPRSN